ncbi:hypothetical protein CRM22_007419 [Opisthorchis felineus]|uniref:Ras-associating domain-containing protein n=1 Tax=Opisthorchis felineus TaxID=147828 RepID=A0A4S2LI61_OPIFE|nr:hypothetical protein CRM22_007419 [Opisthorchis felineus]
MKVLQRVATTGDHSQRSKISFTDQSIKRIRKRYSLASSPTTSQPVNSISNGNGFTRNDVQTRRSDSVYTRAENGFISAQWAAEVNRDIKPEVSVMKAVSSDSAPPACLGAGDACVSPPTSPQPNTPSMALLQATEAGLWCVQNSPSGPQTHTTMVGNGSHVIASTEQHINRPCPTSPLRKTPGLFPNGESHYMYQNYETQEKVIEEMKALAAQRALRSPSYANDVQLGTATPLPQSYIPTSRQTPIPPPRQYVESPHIVSRNSCSTPVSQQQCPLVKKLARDGDDDSSLSGISSWSPGQPPATQRRDMIKGTTLSPPSMNDRLSGSLSPSSSTSDKSGSDHADGNSALHGSRRTLDQNNAKKLVVRIFRPDKTTKAIMIEERMNAGEVASMLIEKNFLKPSTSLAVVEKVPALKIEHVFEEHENVAECILSWPTGSQNMIFFEERKDHFGFIESPKFWLGEEFAEVHRYNSADAVQMMLNNIDQAGFPEWRDYLYIRKPGEKTWSRRLCVLRSSGLYTSKKNKKTLASTDLIRILVLDSHFQLYTTTGGWTRLRAPTPHGFAFKPYSAQDPASTHVFCFCATDEKALRHWVCRLRIAKFGRQLFVDYQNAVARIQRQLAMTYGVPTGLHGMNGSLSACIQRKSSFDILSSSASTAALLPAGSASSLVAGTGSPSIPKRGFLGNNYSLYDQRYPVAPMTKEASQQNQENSRPVSPLLTRNTSSCSAPRSPSYQNNPAFTRGDHSPVARVNFVLPKSSPVTEDTSQDAKPHKSMNYI